MSAQPSAADRDLVAADRRPLGTAAAKRRPRGRRPHTPGIREARAARHQEQARAAAEATLRLQEQRRVWAEADTARAEDLELTDLQRAEAQEAFKARLRASKDPAALTAALERVRDAHARLSPDEASSAAPLPSGDGGPPRKAENSVAASTAETTGDLREQGDETRTQPGSGKPDLGEKYEQRNNRMQKRMRLLDEAREISNLPSLKRCGVSAVSGAAAVTQKTNGDGGFAGLFRCGSVWSCPECMPVVRADRASIYEAYGLAWSQDHDAEACTGCPEDRGLTHKGHGMAMATLTSRHGKHARLEDRPQFDKDGNPVKDKDGKQKVNRGQLQRTTDAWRRMLQSRWWRRMRARYGIVGATRALEVTHSWNNGWHTHIHAVLWMEEPVTDDIARQIEDEMYARWDEECQHAGLGRPTRKHGVKVEAARRGAEGAADLARYLVKVQDKDKETPPPADGTPVNHLSRDARPTADQARRLKDARTRRDQARQQGNRRAEADADSLIADIREEIGQAARARALGNELLRGDTKTARKDGRTAMEILRKALTGDEAEIDLWREYERATKGSRMLTWTGDARERLERLTGQVERESQDVVQDEDAKNVHAVLVQIAPAPWKQRVAAHPGRRGQLRVAVKVASDNALQAGLDMEVQARAVVRELLESWGLVWDVDMFGPEVDMTTGELAGERVVPPPPPEPRAPICWQTPDQLEAEAHLMGQRPRDYVRPEQARRRAAGLPIAREAVTDDADQAVPDPRRLAGHCDRCGGHLADDLIGASGAGRHLLCD